MMMGKASGRNRVHKVLNRSGYGKGGAKQAAERAPSHEYDDIASHVASVESETSPDGKAPKSRLDRKGRAAGGRTPKKDFKPSGKKGKLHREMGIPEDEKIPAGRLRAATHSNDPEKRRDAIRAETMKSWNHKK